ncbi:MAG: TspO/MBR family protein [Burkholderiaceae bacterium]
MLWPLVVTFIGFVIVAGIGIVLTDIGDWYDSLKKPDWKPADKWFGPIWTTIFVLASIAIALAWSQADESQQRLILVAAVANGVLNVFWNVLFFKWRRPDLAFIELVVFWFSIVALMLAVGQASITASLLLLPYLIWVTAAGALNRAIITLNREPSRT